MILPRAGIEILSGHGQTYFFVLVRCHLTFKVDLQSAYCAHHSTETAVLKVLSDILSAADTGSLSMSTLLDLSAAFDTVDHLILLCQLQTSYGLGGIVLAWLTSYLSNRTQYVHCSESTSTRLSVLFGVPQGSVLGPILFLLYTAVLVRLVESLGLQPHLYGRRHTNLRLVPSGCHRSPAASRY